MKFDILGFYRIPSVIIPTLLSLASAKGFGKTKVSFQKQKCKSACIDNYQVRIWQFYYPLCSPQVKSKIYFTISNLMSACPSICQLVILQHHYVLVAPEVSATAWTSKETGTPQSNIKLRNYQEKRKSLIHCTRRFAPQFSDSQVQGMPKSPQIAIFCTAFLLLRGDLIDGRPY